MGLKLPDKWVWDFWFAQDGDNTHIFYLQADKSLKDESLRHWNVSIGHAVSQDLTHWDVLPDALHPSGKPKAGQAEAFDSYTTWTGSVIKHQGTWYMFYTGSRHSENGLIQRIGLATSDDLLTWHKYSSQALIEADSQWYELLDLDAWHDQAWRDPYVVQDVNTGTYHAFITARINTGPADVRGVIGHAISDNLLNWDVLPPITSPGGFGHMEVPQIVQIRERYYLIFCCPYENASIQRRKRTASNPKSGTFYLMADNIAGPYSWDTEGCLFADEFNTLYSGKLIQREDQSWHYIAFRNYDQHGRFIGEIIDPLPVTVDSTGHITVGSST